MHIDDSLRFFGLKLVYLTNKNFQGYPFCEVISLPLEKTTKTIIEIKSMQKMGCVSGASGFIFSICY